MMEKNNSALIVVLILLGLCIIIGLVLKNNYDAGKEYLNHNNVSLSNHDYQSIKENFPNQMVRVCNLENKNCIIIEPLETRG